jgi:O-antigen ligase
MMIPLCFALAWFEERPWIKWFYILVAVLSSCCLVLTHSRAGLVVFLVELWAFVWLLKRRVMLVIAGTITALVLIAALLLIQVVTTDDGHIKFVPRIAGTVNTSTSSFVHRLDIWAFMLPRIVEHPIVGIGYGMETAKMLFGQTPEDVPPGHSPVRKAGSHNVLIEKALHVGLPGLALFLWLAVALWQSLVGGFHRVTDAQDRAILLGVSIGFVGLGVRLQFDQLFVGTLAVQFWVLVALAIAASGSLRGEVASLVKRDVGDAQMLVTDRVPGSLRS